MLTLQILMESLQFPLDHPGEALLRQSAEEVARWSVDHFLALDRQPLGQSASRAELENLLRQPLPEVGEGFTQVFQDFDKIVATHTLKLGHPRFLAFISSAPNFFSILGEWLCASLNSFAGVWLEAAGPAQVELLVLDWFKEFLGCPPQARGILTSGGSEANLTALVVARDQLPAENRDRAVLYLSEQGHHSMNRAAKIVGLRSDQTRVVPVDENYRLRAAALEQAVIVDREQDKFPWAVVANAGATNTGQVDPLHELADCCQRHGLWLHADAAYGWAAALTEEGKKLLRGIDRADSITLDPHKWFAQPFDAGCLLVRQGRLLYESFAANPDYMRDVAATDEEINFTDYGPALTRRFRGLKIWLSLRVMGLKWFCDLVERGLRLAELAEGLLRQMGCFEVLCPRGLSVVCFRYRPPRLWFPNSSLGARAGQEEERLNWLNLTLLDELRWAGRFFVTSTMLRGRVALRCCFVNWRTTSADVQELVASLAQIGERLANSDSRH